MQDDEQVDEQHDMSQARNFPWVTIVVISALLGIFTAQVIKAQQHHHTSTQPVVATPIVAPSPSKVVPGGAL